jgi:hypothetical protein
VTWQDIGGGVLVVSTGAVKSSDRCWERIWQSGTAKGGNWRQPFEPPAQGVMVIRIVLMRQGRPRKPAQRSLVQLVGISWRNRTSRIRSNLDLTRSRRSANRARNISSLPAGQPSNRPSELDLWTDCSKPPRSPPINGRGDALCP